MYRRLSKTVDKTIGNKQWLDNQTLKTGDVEAKVFGKYLTVNGKVPSNIISAVEAEFKEFVGQFNKYNKEIEKELEGHKKLIDLYEELDEYTPMLEKRLKDAFDSIPKVRANFKFKTHVNLGDRDIKQKTPYSLPTVSNPETEIESVRALTKDEILKATDLAKRILEETWRQTWVEFGYERMDKYCFDHLEFEIYEKETIAEFANEHSAGDPGEIGHDFYDKTPLSGYSIAMVQIARALLIWAGKSIEGFKVKY